MDIFILYCQLRDSEKKSLTVQRFQSISSLNDYWMDPNSLVHLVHLILGTSPWVMDVIKLAGDASLFAELLFC